MNKPDFLIVGAMKAGTTTLMEYLIEHPNIIMPNYEVHFFNNDNHYYKGIEWYSDHFRQKRGSGKIYGEKTPTYSYDPKVPKRIYSLYSDMKLVWLFREPVKRTYSNFIHSQMKGTENLTFEEAIDLEEERIKENLSKGYKKRSIYVEQVQRYLQYFPKDQMHYIIFEKFINNPERELKKLYQFLGVKKDGYFQKQSKKIKANISYKPRFIGLQYYSRQLFGDSLPFKLIRGFNRLISFPPPPLNEETEKKLRNYFEPYNHELAKLINIEIPEWN